MKASHAGQAPLSPSAAERLRHTLATHPPRRIFAPAREHLGDIVNVTGPLLELRRLFPDAHIVAEVGERGKDLLDNNPAFDELWLRPTHQGVAGKLAFARRLRSRRFDLAVLLDDSNDLVLHAWLGGIPRRVGIWRGRRFGRLYTACVPLMADRHEVRDNCRDLLHLLGSQAEDLRPVLFPSRQDRLDADGALRKALGGDPGGPIVGVHPGASEPRRRWDLDLLAAVVDGLAKSGARPLLVGGPADQPLVDDLAARTACRPARLTRPLRLLPFACLLGRLDLLVCGDTGPMHIAAAMDTPTVAVFGPSVPVHTGPWGSRHALIKGDCTSLKRDCQNCDGRCMRSVPPEHVLDAALKLLGSSRCVF